MIGENVNYNEEYKIGMATDGANKVQIKFPAHLDLHGQAFLLNLGIVDWTGFLFL
jgi:hypothetical protein